MTLIDITVDTDTLRAELDDRPTQDDVERMISDEIESQLDTAVSNALDDHDFSSDVEATLDGWDFSRVDAISELDDRVQTLEDASPEATFERVEKLESDYSTLLDRVLSLEARLADDSRVGKGLTLLDLLQQAFRIISGS